MRYSEGPDKGHAWVIAIAAGFITMILSGVTKIDGMLYVAVLDTYGVTRKQATLPFTFRKSIRCLTGPVVGIIGQRYGIRSVTIFGAVVGTIGVALCFVAPNIVWLTCCWGVINGVGNAFANTIFQVTVDQYFEKYRSTASGISTSGNSLGLIFFSFAIEALVDTYGLQGTFLILSGIILNVIPAGILLKSPSWVREEGTKPPPRSLTESIKDRPRMYVVPDDNLKTSVEKKQNTISFNTNTLEKDKILSVTNLPFKSHSSTNFIEDLETRLDGIKGCDNKAFTIEKDENPKNSLQKTLSIQNVTPTSKENMCERIPSTYDLQEDSSFKIKANETWVKNTQREYAEPKSMFDNLKAIGRLYKNPVYVLSCVCMATYVLVFIPVMTSVVDYNKDKGLPETAGKYLIQAIAVGDLIGRLCFGWVTDKEYIAVHHYIVITQVLEGIFIILLPFTYSLGGFLSLLALYSMTGGSVVVRLPVLILKHVKKEESSVAMGCYIFISGIVPLVSPLLIGNFRDQIGSYDGMYVLLGCILVVSGALWFLEPYLVRLNERLEGRRTAKSGI